MHQDHVPLLPEGFETLGDTDICPVHGMVRYAAGTDFRRQLQDIEIITLQGERLLQGKRLIQDVASSGYASSQMHGLCTRQAGAS